MLGPLKLVIFDLDGTLVDSIPDIVKATNRALLESGRTAISAEKCREMVGWGINELARLVLLSVSEPDTPEATAELATEITKCYFDDPVSATFCYPGIETLLCSLKQNDVRMLVYTNKVEQVAKRVVGELFPDELIDMVIGQRDDRPAKPDPSALISAMQELHTSHDEAVLVGDSDVDIQTAKAADMRSIGAAWGYRGRTHLEQAGADFVFDSASELGEVLLDACNARRQA